MPILKIFLFLKEKSYSYYISLHAPKRKENLSKNWQKIILDLLFTFIMASGNIWAFQWAHGIRASHLTGHDMDSMSTLVDASPSYWTVNHFQCDREVIYLAMGQYRLNE
jgi:hypothetical protein